LKTRYHIAWHRSRQGEKIARSQDADCTIIDEKYCDTFITGLEAATMTGDLTLLAEHGEFVVARGHSDITLMGDSIGLVHRADALVKHAETLARLASTSPT
jgi:hypothetical protein